MSASKQEANIEGDLDTVRSSISVVPNTTTRIITIKARTVGSSVGCAARTIAAQRSPAAPVGLRSRSSSPATSRPSGPDSPAQQAADLAAPGMITVLDAPVTPTDPVHESTTFAALIGAVVATTVAFAGVVALDTGRARRERPEPTALVQRRLLGRCRLAPRNRLFGRSADRRA